MRLLLIVSEVVSLFVSLFVSQTDTRSWLLRCKLEKTSAHRHSSAHQQALPVGGMPSSLKTKGTGQLCPSLPKDKPILTRPFYVTAIMCGPGPISQMTGPFR